MPEKKSLAPFVDYFVNLKSTKPTKLDAIDMMIDWRPAARKLDKSLKRTANVVGKPAYPALLLFKGLILQRMYNLSDVELEEQIRDRFSFRRFVGLGAVDDVPDATTFCRFRNDLLGEKLSEKLFHLILDQLLKKGDFRQGVSVDATVVQSSRRPRTTMEIVPNDRSEPDLAEQVKDSQAVDQKAEASISDKLDTAGQLSKSPSDELQGVSNDKVDHTTAEQVMVTHSDDTDAAWLKKGKKTYYGYKVHMASDAHYGLVMGGHVTPANRSDMNELERVLAELPEGVCGGRCYADKGYTSKVNRDVVREKGFKDGIMDKATRGKQLTHWQKIRNKCISSVRCGIERIFGTFKRCRDFARSRYVGMAKVEQEFFIVALSYNLVRARTLCFG